MTYGELFKLCDTAANPVCMEDDCQAMELCEIFQARHGTIPSRGVRRSHPEWDTDEEIK